jgi:hypothetical protein
MILVATKNGGTKKIFLPPLLVQLLDPRSGMDKNQIRDQHPGSTTLRIRIHGTAVWYDPRAALTWTETLHPGLAAAALRVNFHILLDASRCGQLNRQNKFYITSSVHFISVITAYRQ